MNVLIIDNANPDARLEDGRRFNQPLIDAVAQHVPMQDVQPGYYQDVYDQLRHDHDKSDRLAAKFGAVILSGVPMDYDKDTADGTRRELAQFCLDSGVPLLGICLGHQLIGHCNGVDVEWDDAPEEGLQELLFAPADLTTGLRPANDPLFDGLTRPIRIRAMHRASIVPPADFTTLASTRQCRNFIMRQGQVAGIQGHPELSGKDGVQILGNFLNEANQRLPKAA